MSNQCWWSWRPLVSPRGHFHCSGGRRYHVTYVFSFVRRAASARQWSADLQMPFVVIKYWIFCYFFIISCHQKYYGNRVAKLLSQSEDPERDNSGQFSKCVVRSAAWSSHRGSSPFKVLGLIPILFHLPSSLFLTHALKEKWYTKSEQDLKYYLLTKLYDILWILHWAVVTEDSFFVQQLTTWHCCEW